MCFYTTAVDGYQEIKHFQRCWFLPYFLYLFTQWKMRLTPCLLKQLFLSLFFRLQFCFLVNLTPSLFLTKYWQIGVLTQILLVRWVLKDWYLWRVELEIKMSCAWVTWAWDEIRGEAQDIRNELSSRWVSTPYWTPFSSSRNWQMLSNYRVMIVTRVTRQYLLLTYL